MGVGSSHLFEFFRDLASTSALAPLLFRADAQHRARRELSTADQSWQTSGIQHLHCHLQLEFESPWLGQGYHGACGGPLTRLADPTTTAPSPIHAPLSNVLSRDASPRARHGPLNSSAKLRSNSRSFRRPPRLISASRMAASRVRRT